MIFREFDVSRNRPRLGGLPHLDTFTWQNVTPAERADRDTRLGALPHLSCKRDHIKLRDSMDRRVTPPKQVSSPTWGPSPPCKQVLRYKKKIRDKFSQGALTIMAIFVGRASKLKNAGFNCF